MACLFEEAPIYYLTRHPQAMNVTIDSPFAASLLSRLPEGIPVSVQAVLATIVLGTIYSVVTKDRPFSGIPLISLDGKSAKKSWLWNGREVIKAGQEKVSPLDAGQQQQHQASRGDPDSSCSALLVLWTVPSHDWHRPQDCPAQPLCRRDQEQPTNVPPSCLHKGMLTTRPDGT